MYADAPELVRTTCSHTCTLPVPAAGGDHDADTLKREMVPSTCVSAPAQPELLLDSVSEALSVPVRLPALKLAGVPVKTAHDQPRNEVWWPKQEREAEGRQARKVDCWQPRRQTMLHTHRGGCMRPLLGGACLCAAAPE